MTSDEDNRKGGRNQDDVDDDDDGITEIQSTYPKRVVFNFFLRLRLTAPAVWIASSIDIKDL